MDITNLFKASVKTVRTTNKSLGIKEQKSNLLKNKEDTNLAKPKVIIKQIKSLDNLIKANKAAYLNVANYISSNKVLTDETKDTIDSSSEDILKTCSLLIEEFKKEASRLGKTNQQKEHYENVGAYIESYLKRVGKMYTEIKASRMKRGIEKHKISKLSLNVSKSKTPDNVIPTNSLSFDDTFSSEEMQMFEEENALLYNELNNVMDEVKQMESKVVQIAELQELFTEKVLQQESDIERISTTVVNTSENMRDANDQIRQAIQRNAGLRVWVLFFLLVMSFSLLFLDWYND